MRLGAMQVNNHTTLEARDHSLHDMGVGPESHIKGIGYRHNLFSAACQQTHRLYTPPPHRRSASACAW